MTAQLVEHYRPASSTQASKSTLFKAAGYYTWLNPKFIRLETPGELPRILKLAKALRSRSPLADGTWVYVRGTCKFKGYAPKYKVEELSTSPLTQTVDRDTTRLTGTSTAARSQDVAVCLKKNCCRRGAETIWATLEATEGLTPVESGCLKACKHGPAIAIGKHVFSGRTALADLQSALK